MVAPIPSDVILHNILPFLYPQSRSMANTASVSWQFRKLVSSSRQSLLDEIASLADRIPTIAVWWHESQRPSESSIAANRESDAEPDASSKLAAFFETLERLFLASQADHQLRVWFTLQTQSESAPHSIALTLCARRVNDIYARVVGSRAQLPPAQLSLNSDLDSPRRNFFMTLDASRMEMETELPMPQLSIRPVELEFPAQLVTSLAEVAAPPATGAPSWWKRTYLAIASWPRNFVTYLARMFHWIIR